MPVVDWLFEGDKDHILSLCKRCRTKIHHEHISINEVCCEFVSDRLLQSEIVNQHKSQLAADKTM